MVLLICFSLSGSRIFRLPVFFPFQVTKYAPLPLVPLLPTPTSAPALALGANILALPRNTFRSPLSSGLTAISHSTIHNTIPKIFMSMPP